MLPCCTSFDHHTKDDARMRKARSPPLTVSAITPVNDFTIHAASTQGAGAPIVGERNTRVGGVTLADSYRFRERDVLFQ